MADETKDPAKARNSATEAYFKRTQQIDKYLLTFPAPRGRARAIDWDVAISGVWGKIYRREVPEPKRQSEVEQLLSDWFIDSDKDAGDSSIRKQARIIWNEVTKGH